MRYAILFMFIISAMIAFGQVSTPDSIIGAVSKAESLMANAAPATTSDATVQCLLVAIKAQQERLDDLASRVAVLEAK